MHPNTIKWTDKACIQTSSNRGCRIVSPLKQPLLIGLQTSAGLPEFKIEDTAKTTFHIVSEMWQSQDIFDSDHSIMRICIAGVSHIY